MRAAFILGVVVAVATLSVATPTDVPDEGEIDWSFHCEAEGKFAHPTKCGMYYHCVKVIWRIVPFKIPCPLFWHFNEEAGRCTFGKCPEPEPEPEPVPEPEPEPTPITCSEEKLFVNPDNCSEYYECYKSGDEFVLFPARPCPAGLVFCNKEQICNWVDSCNSNFVPDVLCQTNQNNMFLGKN